MSTNNKWIKLRVVGEESTMNSKVIMSNSQVNDLWYWVIDNPIQSAIFGDYTKWCSSLIFYPFKLTDTTTEYKLRVGGTESDRITCLGSIPVNSTFGYTLGQRYYPTATNFLDYEPYIKVQIWLPFYGFVDVKVADIQGKYIQFRLYVDYNSGTAQYVIGANSARVAVPTSPYVAGIDDTDTRIIGTYTFQLGYQIPITSTGWAETVRNTALMAVKTAGSLVGSYASSGAGLTSSQSTARTVKTARNPKTGRQITKSTQTKTTDYSQENYASANRISTSLESVGDILGSFHASPSMDKANNSIINSACANSIVIVTKRVIPAIERANEIYRHTIGSPTAKVGIVSDFYGYTECSGIHFEGNGFGTATQAELSEIEQLFSNGVLLRDREQVVTIQFTLTTDDEETVTLDATLGMTWQEWVDSAYNTVGAYITDADTRVFLPQIVSGAPPYIIDSNGETEYSWSVIVNGETYNIASDIPMSV